MSFGEGDLRERVAELERELESARIERDRYMELWTVQCDETACQSAAYVAEQKLSIALEGLVRDVRAHAESLGIACMVGKIDSRMAEMGLDGGGKR